MEEYQPTMIYGNRSLSLSAFLYLNRIFGDWNDAGMRSELLHLVRHRFDGGSSSSLVDDAGDLRGRFLDSRDVDIEAVED